MVRSIAPAPTPSSSDAAPVRTASSMRDSGAQPVPTSPITASASTATPSKVIRAARLASASRSGAACSPSAPRSTANRVIPSSSPGSPPLRAATISRSAAWPCCTKLLAPVRRKPLPERSARSAVRAGRWCGPSSIASAATASPDRMRGSQLARCAALPCLSAVTAPTAVERKGDGVRLRPTSSSTIPASTAPSPSPPSASSIRMPVKPISPNCRQSAGA